MCDLISREAATKAIEELISARYEWLIDARDEIKGLDAAICEIQNLPTAEKTGKWINDKGLYRCSVCNELWCDWWASCVSIERMNKIMHYCPNCGARMGEKEE